MGSIMILSWRTQCPACPLAEQLLPCSAFISSSVDGWNDGACYAHYWKFLPVMVHSLLLHVSHAVVTYFAMLVIVVRCGTGVAPYTAACPSYNQGLQGLVCMSAIKCMACCLMVHSHLLDVSRNPCFFCGARRLATLLVNGFVCPSMHL